MKNKEIEELLNELKEYASGGMSGLYPSEDTVKNFVSYIEQLENLCNKYEQEHKTTFEIWKKDIKKLEQLENNREKAIEVIDLITPELWNISNAMTYKLKDIKYILKGGSDEQR